MSSTTERIGYVIVAVWFVSNVVNLIRGSDDWIDHGLQWALMLCLAGMLLRERRLTRRRAR